MTARNVPEIVARAWERTPRQRALESHVKGALSVNVKDGWVDTYMGAARRPVSLAHRSPNHLFLPGIVYFHKLELVPLLGEPRVYEMFKSVVETCVEAGIVREATDLVAAIVKRKRLLTDEHNKELQGLLLAQAVQEDDYTSAIKSVLMEVAADPHSVALGNALGRLVRKAPRDDVSRAVIRRMAAKQGDSVPLHMLSGNAFSLSRNYQMALDRFVAAYRLQPADPLIPLAVAAVLARVVAHRKVVDRHGTLVRSLAFLERYAMLRRAQPPEPMAPAVVAALAAAETEDAGGDGDGKGQLVARRAAAAKLAVEQEVVYNTARALHQAGLGHAAVHLYQDCLAFYDAHKAALDGDLGGNAHVTKEAAYNLVRIYEAAGSRDLARMVAERYLRVE